MLQRTERDSHNNCFACIMYTVEGLHNRNVSLDITRVGLPTVVSLFRSHDSCWPVVSGGLL